MSSFLNPPLSARNGRTLKVIFVCRVSRPGPGKQSIESLDDQEKMHLEWLRDNTDIPCEITVIAGSGSGELLDREEYLRLIELVAMGICTVESRNQTIRIVLLYWCCQIPVRPLKPVCERFGMPLMVEPLVMQPNAKAGGYIVDGDVRKIVSLVRQAVELGADIIKADPCDNVEEYHLVVEAGGHCPVLPRGGGRVPATEVLARTKALMAQGVAGIVYGRNVIQHENPRAMTRALMAIVHGNASLEEANQLLHESSGTTRAAKQTN